MAVVLGVLTFFMLAASDFVCYGLVVQPCGNSSRVVSVKEDSYDLLLVCGGLNLAGSNTTVFWTFQDRSQLTPTTISTCSQHRTTGAWSCSKDWSVMIHATMNEYSFKSHLIVPNIYRHGFPDGTWRCQQDGHTAECTLDVVAIADDISCNVTVDEDKATVSGECHMSRMFSSQDIYSCQWYEQVDNRTQTEVAASVTRLTLRDCNTTQTAYKCGVCSFSKQLPLAQMYSYTVLIQPGNVLPPVAYTFVPSRSPPPSTPGSASTTTSATANGVTSTPASSASSIHAVTSSAGVASSLGTTPLEGGIIKDDGNVTSALFQGIGIGIAAILVIVVIVVIIAAIVLRRQRKRRPPGTFDDLNRGVQNGGLTPEDGDSCCRPSGVDRCPSDNRGTSRTYLHLLPDTCSPPLTVPGHRASENHYSTLMNLSTRLQPSEEVAPPASTPALSSDDVAARSDDVAAGTDDVAANSLTSVKRVVSHKSDISTARRLPDLPSEDTYDQIPADRGSYLIPIPLNKAAGQDARDGTRDGAYQGHIMQDSNQTGGRYEPMSAFPPGYTSAPQNVLLQPGGETPVPVANPNPRFSDLGFREQSNAADYIYFKNGNIPVSDPI